MNKKGISDLYMLIIQIIAVGFIFTLLMYKAQDVDIDGIHRNLVAKDIGLTLNTISFLPTNIKYTYLTKDNKNWVKWDPFYIELKKNSITYYEKMPSLLQSSIKPGKYTFISNKLKSYEGYIKKGILNVKENSFKIQKTDTIKVTKEDVSNLNKYDCKKTTLKYQFKPLRFCDEFKEDGMSLQFRDSEGNKIPNEEKDFTIRYDKLKKKYFLGDKEFFKCEGLVNKESFETEIISQILNQLNQLDKSNKQDSFKTIYLTLNNKSTNDVIVRIPLKDFEKYYDVGCNIINNLLEKNSNIDGTLIIPTRENKITLELGSIKYKQDIDKIVEALNNG